MAKYSVVIPCYNSSKTIEKVVSLTAEELRKLNILDFEFVLVNDCTPDGGATLSVLRDLAAKHEYVKVVDLGKNSGQHNATMAGFYYASGDFIICMDDDMQTHPSQIGKMKEKLDEGYDIVYGYYPKKKESLFRRFGSFMNYITVRALIHKPKWMKTSSFFMIRRYVRDYAIMYKFPSVHLQGIFLRITRNIACVPVEHFEREVGKSNYTLKKLIRLYANIVGYSVTPLRIVTSLGAVFAVVGFAFDLWVLIRKIMNPSIAAGWASMFGGLCFFSGIMLIAIGVVGNYVGRLYIGQSNSPQYVVREVINIEDKPYEKANDSGSGDISGSAD